MAKPIGAQAIHFYKRVLRLLLENNLPFMVGGTFAFGWYTGIFRHTKDLDIFSTPETYPAILHVAAKAGYTTELLDEHWIAKIHHNENTADIIFAEKNGLNNVSPSWFDRAPTAKVLGCTVMLMPLEEMIKSKAFIQNTNRFDGPDVIHLILRRGKEINWNLLLSLMDSHWEVFLAHLINFIFVYPSDRDLVPRWVMDKLVQNLCELLATPTKKTKITRGLLYSIGYKVSIEKWGYKDGVLLGRLEEK